MSGQGFRNSGLLMAFTFACATLGSLGWYEIVGVGFSTGLMAEANSTIATVSNPSAQASGTTNIGFFGIAVGAVQTLMSLATLNVELYGILITTFAMPAPLALPIQLMYNFTFGMSILAVLRGFNVI